MAESDGVEGSAKRRPDDEVRVMGALTRVMQDVQVANPQLAAAIATLAMQPLTQTDLAAVRTVTRLLGSLQTPIVAARVRTWLYDRFGLPALGGDGQNPNDAAFR
jgi:hypothetical protein